MAKSFGEALAKHMTVVIQSDGHKPKVMMKKGRKVEAFDLLEKTGAIEVIYYENTGTGRRPTKA